MHRMHRIFSGDGWLVVLGIRVASGKAFEFERAFAEMDEQSHLKSACHHCRSQPFVQQPLVLIILCILRIDVQFIVLLDGSAPSRWAGPGSQANGSFPKGTGRLSEKWPAGYPPPHHRDAPPGSAGVPPACCPLGCRSVSLRCCSRPPARREPQGPGRSRGRAPLPVDSGGGDGRSCGRICAGVPPALPGGLPPMTGSHQRDKSAEAFWRQLSLKEVHQSSCLFVSIGGSSSFPER